jgi:hypothetical protein
MTEVIQSNILIDQEGRAELTDFGLSVILSEEDVGVTTSSDPCRWNVPELFVGVDVHRTCGCDVHAFGRTCLEVCAVIGSSTRGLTATVDLHRHGLAALAPPTSGASMSLCARSRPV